MEALVESRPQNSCPPRPCESDLVRKQGLCRWNEGEGLRTGVVPALATGPSPEESEAGTAEGRVRGPREDGGRDWGDAAGAQEGASRGALEGANLLPP